MDCGVLYSLHTSEEQPVLSLDNDWFYRFFRRHIVYGVFTVISVDEDLIPEVLQIVKCLTHKFASAFIRICQQIIKFRLYLLDHFRCFLTVTSAVNYPCHYAFLSEPSCVLSPSDFWMKSRSRYS